MTAAYGGGELHAIGPGPFVLSRGAVGPDHTIGVALRWDHRITDAAPIARLDPAGTGAERRKSAPNCDQAAGPNRRRSGPS
jgi:hypothetical protein